MPETIGFIGLGKMGHGMAHNLATKGFPLVVLANRSRDAVEDLLAKGASEVRTAREMAERCDIVVLCVTGSPQVEARLGGDDGLAAAGREMLVIDCSTSEPAVTVRLAAELAARGITLIDAPLSRTPKEAWAGTLDVMVGGAEDAVARAMPVIESFAGRIVKTGPTGTGHTMKLLNNFVSLGYAALYAEALMVGAKAGMSREVFHEVLAGGRMDCGFFKTFFEYAVGGNRQAHIFTLDNALKDLTYLSGFANAVQAANPVGAAVRNSFATAIGLGRGTDYVPMLTDVIGEINGVTSRETH